MGRVSIVPEGIEPRRVNAISVVPKSNRGLRLCLDARLINACMPRWPLCYPTADDMVAEAAKLGGVHRGVWYTFDIADAFSTISIDDRSRKALGAVHWPGVGHLLYEKAPFGLASSSALLAITLSFSVELALDAVQARFGAVACDVYCDDGSLFVPDPLFQAHGQAVWELFSDTMRDLGWRFSESKTSGTPSRVFEQRGLAFDFSSSPGFISLKVDKRREYGGEFLGLAKRGRNGEHVSYRELRSLPGKARLLSGACMINPTGAE